MSKRFGNTQSVQTTVSVLASFSLSEETYSKALCFHSNKYALYEIFLFGTK